MKGLRLSCAFDSLPGNNRAFRSNVSVVFETRCLRLRAQKVGA